MLDFVFSRIYPGCPNFQETFLIDKKELLKPSGPVRLERLVREHARFENNPRANPEKVPRFVYVMNEYYVLSGSRFYKCHDFLDAYLQWLYLCCSHRVILGVPAVKINLLSQFLLFFPTHNDDIQRLRSRHETKTDQIKNNLGMPQSYQSLSVGVKKGEHVRSEKYLF
jgi:hypothetical protein